jgi:hypothetical protein
MTDASENCALETEFIAGVMNILIEGIIAEKNVSNLT